MILAATGHRPDKLGGYGLQVRRALGALACEYLHERRPEKVISGMALGWDQAIAAAALICDIPLVAAVPMRGQADPWPEEARRRWRRLLDGAAEVVIVAEAPGTPEFAGPAALMQLRNEWMVDRADHIVALHDGSTGGTFNCLRYAARRGVSVENVWWRWSLPEDAWELL